MAKRFLRFLLEKLMVSQDITKDRFAFVPVQDFKQTWSDTKLYKKYDLDKNEQEFIESCIRRMTVEDED